MVKTLGVVHVGSSGSGVTNRFGFAERRLAGKPLLDWVVRRVTESQHVDRTVVVLEDDPQQHRLAKLVPPDVDVFRASGSDALSGVVSAIHQYDAESLIVVDLENPFIDPSLIDRLVVDASEHRCDYVSFCLRSDKNLLASRLGMIAQWCRGQALIKADAESASPVERSRITPYVYSHPEKFSVRFIPVPKQLDRNDIRLAIEGEEDWYHAHLILEALGPEDLDWQRIAGLLDQHPAIREKMADLNRSVAKSSQDEA